ncbi:MAG: GntR family transcriptional regulator [Chloroflexia bacterium]
MTPLHVFQELGSASLKDLAVAALKDSFFAGTLKPGDAIVERKLARQMNVGSPTVREALIVLQEQGFLRRVANTATYVTKFRTDEVRDLYALRVEWEILAFQWAKPRVTPIDLDRLDAMVDRLVEAGESGNRRRFLEADVEFHDSCWQLSGNKFLTENLRRLMMPLFTFVVLASGAPLTASMAREHYALVNALRNLNEPEFSVQVRRSLTGFAFRWISTMASQETLASDPTAAR